MISKYFCAVLGINQVRTSHWHASTLRRAEAFALAIHIPVIMWAVSGYMSARTVFQVSESEALAVGAACALLIYMVERVVLATPKGLWVTVLRVGMGLVIATLGSMTLDLVIFKKEIEHQLNSQARAQLKADHLSTRSDLLAVLESKKNDWQTAQSAANCEANGTCGSGLRNVGPVYRELAQQAEFLKAEYLAAQGRLHEQDHAHALALEALYASGQPSTKAGLLVRVVALHEVVQQETTALLVWCLFFVLLLMFELLVVLCKLMFKDTVDDEIDRQREILSHHKATAYVDALTSPLTQARKLMVHELA